MRTFYYGSLIAQDSDINDKSVYDSVKQFIDICDLLNIHHIFTKLS